MKHDAQTPTAGSALAMLEAVAPGERNTRNLLQAAYSLHVPVKRLADSTVQYGWGARSRWMESTFTDSDSVISARLAHDKSASHALIKSAGLPVPLKITRLFRLQLARVDLITTDISRLLREARGAVSQVNGQPQFSGDCGKSLASPVDFIGGWIAGERLDGSSWEFHHG